MGAHHQVMLMVGGGAGASGYWNPADKSADVTLSDGTKRANTTAAPGSIRGVRGLTGKTTGDWCFEVATTAGYINSDLTDVYVGVASAGVALTGQPIFGSLGGQYVSVRGNTQYGSDAGYGGTHSGSGWASANGVNVVMVAVYTATRTVEVYDAGGLLLTLTYSSTGGAAVFPWAQMTELSAAGVTLRVLASEFSLSIPSGCAAWG